MDRSGAIMAEKYLMTHYKLTKQRLPPPYKTMCIHYADHLEDVHARSQCKHTHTCMRNMSISILNLVPFSSFQDHPTDLKSISYLDSLNETIRSNIFKFADMCDTICK